MADENTLLSSTCVCCTGCWVKSRRRTVCVPHFIHWRWWRRFFCKGRRRGHNLRPPFNVSASPAHHDSSPRLRGVCSATSLKNQEALHFFPIPSPLFSCPCFLSATGEWFTSTLTDVVYYMQGGYLIVNQTKLSS